VKVLRTHLLALTLRSGCGCCCGCCYYCCYSNERRSGCDDHDGYLGDEDDLDSIDYSAHRNSTSSVVAAVAAESSANAAEVFEPLELLLVLPEIMKKKTVEITILPS
jgi:hypothetical protein